MSRGRRAALLGGIGLLAGCGFHPLLGPARSTGSSNAARLHTIYVGVMPERNGQVLRTALQTRLDGGAAIGVRRYELLAPLAISIDFSAIQRDNSTTRFTITASCAWSLLDIGPPRLLVTTGSARVLDGFDQINQQYLSAEFATEDAIRRISANIADQIVQQIASYFDGAGLA